MAFPRLARIVAAWAAAVVLGAQVLAAQGTTGKVEGTVRDQSGAAINGAQVLIQGTAFNGLSNERGYYFINNVPAGVYTIRAQYIGYAPAEVRNVRVFANQTMTVDIPMEARAIEVSGVTVTVEQTPIVPRDQVASKAITSGDVITALPLDNVREVLRLQPGVVEGRTGQTFRGGRPGEAATYIDGVLVRNLTGASSGVSVGTNAIEEASVTTGALGAEYGDAQSGVVNLVTRAGGQRLRGNLAFSTDEPSGQVYGMGLSRLEASLSGPLLARGLTFFIATTLQGQQNGAQNKGRQNVPSYALAGVDTTVTIAMTPNVANSDSQVVDIPKFVRYSNGTRRPLSWSSSYSLDSKLQYTFGSGSRLSFTYHYTGGEGMNTGLSYNTMANYGNWNGSSAYILNWTQSLVQTRERALFVDATVSYQRDQTVNASVDPQWTLSHQKPFMWFTFARPDFLYDLKKWPINDRLINNIRLGNCPNYCVPDAARNDLYGVANFRFSPYGVFATTTGILTAAGPALSQESRFTGRVNFDWQANRYNRVHFGGDFVSTHSEYYNARDWNTTFFLNAWKGDPFRYGLFASDRVDLGDVVIDLGLRYDRMDSKLQYPRAPGRTFTDPIRTGSLVSTFTAADTAMAQRCGQLYAALPNGSYADSTAWATCNYFRAQPAGALSPRIGVSFPVTDKTGFRLSYAHQLQTPSFAQMAQGINEDVSGTNTNDYFARPLTFGKTIMFEFGIRHAFSPDMVLDISAYNKDALSNITARIVSTFDPTTGKVSNLNMWTNADFGNVRGIDIKLDRRIGSLFQGTVVYTYQSNLTTGSDPNEYVARISRATSNVTQDRAPPPQALMVSAENRYHNIAGNLALNFPHGWHSGTTLGRILEDVGITTTFRFASGLPYTPIPLNSGSGITGPGNAFGDGATLVGTETMNSGNMPWIKNVDLRVTRGFRVSGRDLTVFADFRNLFNWTNLTSIFAETGDVVNDVYRTKWESGYSIALQNEAGSLYHLADVTKNGVTTRMPVIDLTDCNAYAPTRYYGVPNCIMLRRAEARFGNGDGILDQTEMDNMLGQFYIANNGPWTFYGAGLNIRFGFEFNF